MNILDRLKQPFRNHKLRKEQLEELKNLYRTILKDGKVSDDELAHLDRFYQRTALTSEKIEQVKVEAFQILVNMATADRRLTESEFKSLRHIAKRLQVPYDHVQQMENQTSFYSTLHRYENCLISEFPTISPDYLLLQKDEIAYLQTPCSLLEERVVKRQYVGASSGVSFRIMKGVTYRVGQSRGELVTQTGIVPVSDGWVVITNQRVVFSGARKSASVAYKKLIDLQMFSDALKFAVSNRQKPIIVGEFQYPQAIEIGAIIISRILNESEEL